MKLLSVQIDQVSPDAVAQQSQKSSSKNPTLTSTQQEPPCVLLMAAERLPGVMGFGA